MHLLTVTRLAAASILNRKATALLTILAIAVSVMLFVGVERVRQAARESFERTISGADLIVGARSGPVNLVLYSIFHIGDATNNITWETYKDLASREQVAWTIPISLGDSHRGYRVVGTNTDYFRHYKYADDRGLTFAEGKPFDDLFDVVLGSEVARALHYKIGDSIVVSHGLGDVSFMDHKDKPFRISGILAPTGTPVDRSLHVSLEAIEAIHVGWESGAMTPLARLATADRVRAMDLEPTTVTAMIIGLKSRPAVLRMQRDINTYPEEPLLAVIPGVALSQLWEVVGVIEQALAAISACVVAVGLIVVLVSILTALNERRREMAILRSVGARPSDIFLLLVAEAGLLALCGAFVGVMALYGGLTLLKVPIQQQTGITLVDLWPGSFDLVVVFGVALAASVLASLPAWRAYRNSLADGLSIRI
ncbi:MAG: FtsX-like permease family protein [Hyphomonadaceae bacterium]